MEDGDALSVVFLGFWKRLGFNMKIVFCQSRALFVGWHIECSQGTPTGLVCPELPRALKKSGISCSSAAVQAAKEDDVSSIKRLAAANAIARAYEFAGILPTVSGKYVGLARSLTTETLHDHEMSMRAKGEAGHSSQALLDEIDGKNLDVTPVMEQESLARLGYAATASELVRFTVHTWDFGTWGNRAAFRESLPASWRE